jgi:hypothetical protein
MTFYFSSLSTITNNNKFHKTSLTILLYKKADPTNLTNHRPIALANTIYKLFTSTLTTILSTYGKHHQILHDSQEGLRSERSTSCQLQLLIAYLEDAKFTTQDIFLLYIDFKNAFGSIDHARLLAIMCDLGYPTDVISLVGNIYFHSTTIFSGTSFGHMPPINIQCGTIQGDTLSPYLFLIFLEPLLRWIQRGNHGYTFKTSNSTICFATYADDLVLLSHNTTSLQVQLHKLEFFCDWSGMDLGISKCALTGSPNHSKMNPITFKAFLQIKNISFHNHPIPVLHQNEPYLYLGIQLVPSLNWNIQTHVTSTKLIQQCKLLSNCLATIKQKIHMANIVIRPGISYSFYAVPYSMPTIRKLDKRLIVL